MSLFQALVLALLQGVTELFPVSSLGHTVILPKLLGWNINQADPTFLAFVVLLHVGTAIALAIYFWRDWVAIIGAVFRSVVDGRMHGTAEERLGWRLIAGTVPAGLVGVLFQKQVQSLFANPRAAAAFLIANGVIMFVGERVRRRAGANRSWHRFGADPCAAAGHFPLREHDGRRPAGQPHARGRCALRVSTGDAHHSWRRPSQDPGPLHPGRVAPSPGLPGWRRDGWRGRLPERRLPHAILSGGTA